MGNCGKERDIVQRQKEKINIRSKANERGSSAGGQQENVRQGRKGQEVARVRREQRFLSQDETMQEMGDVCFGEGGEGV